MSDKCTAVHPEFRVPCILDANHVKPDGFDMGQYTDYSSMSPGSRHEFRFKVTWLDETVENGFFEGGKIWEAS